jgi:hypothetical protein
MSIECGICEMDARSGHADDCPRNDSNKILDLICACCGSSTSGRQWWNRDVGYGLCVRCIKRVSRNETPEHVRECYGENGTHYNIEKNHAN